MGRVREQGGRAVLGLISNLLNSDRPTAPSTLTTALESVKLTVHCRTFGNPGSQADAIADARGVWIQKASANEQQLRHTPEITGVKR